MSREGRRLSDYRLHMGPQGYRPLREFLVKKLKRDAAIDCTADDILMLSGSLQGLDLVNAALLDRGDTVICERDCYQGTINRYTRRGINVDRHATRQRRHAHGRAGDGARPTFSKSGVRPKFIYTIATVQNPTATILSFERRVKLLQLAEAYGVPIFEDDCYADLTWTASARPPSTR